MISTSSINDVETHRLISTSSINDVETRPYDLDKLDQRRTSSISGGRR
jgi:hypothetical protein